MTSELDEDEMRWSEAHALLEGPPADGLPTPRLVLGSMTMTLPGAGAMGPQALLIIGSIRTQLSDAATAQTAVGLGFRWRRAPDLHEKEFRRRSLESGDSHTRIRATRTRGSGDSRAGIGRLAGSGRMVA